MNSIWAVARNTISQALRMKLALAVVVLLLVLLPIMSVIMIGDGTLVGKLQTFISYSISLISLLLCVMTIIISTYSLSDDIKTKRIFLVVTKPLRRYQIILGKLLGVIVLDVFLLAVFASIVYGLTMMIPRLDDSPKHQLAVAQKEFFTARKALSTELDDEFLRKAALEQYEKLRQAGQIPAGMATERAIQSLTGQIQIINRAVGAGQRKVWEFQKVKISDPDEPVFVRYKYEPVSSSPGDKIFGVWLVGDYRQIQYGMGKRQTPIYELQIAHPIDTFHEIAIPGDAVAEDGYLAVVFVNDRTQNSDKTVIIQGLEVLYRAAGFTSNFIKCVLLVFVRLVFLAALGVSLSSWLSFPVAVLVSSTVFFIGTINSFIVESFSYLGPEMGLVYRYLLRPLMALLPKFDGSYNPSGFIVPGRLIEWNFLAEACLLTVVLKCSVLVILGIWIFSRREIARISA